MGSVQISAKTDYALRALLILADAAADGSGLVKIDVLSHRQGLPRKFVESILAELRRAGLVTSRRGSDGGYALARPASEITVGAVIRVVDGPLAEVHGRPAHEGGYVGVAQHLPEVWVAMRAALRSVLDETTLEQVLTGAFPPHVSSLGGRVTDNETRA